MRIGGAVLAPRLAVSMGPLPTNGPTSFSKKIKRFGVASSVGDAGIGAGSTIAIGLIVSNANGLGLLSGPRIGFPRSFRMCSPGISGGFHLAGSNLSNDGIVRCLTVPHGTKACGVPTMGFDCFSVGSHSCGALAARRCRLRIRGKTNGTTRAVTGFADGRRLGMLGRSVHFVGRGGIALSPGNSFFFNSLAC